METAVPSQAAPSSKKQWWLIALVIVVLAGACAALGYWWYQTHEHTVRIPDGTPKVVAPAGKVVSEFPKEMILEPDARVEGSYSLHYATGGVRYPIVQYLSAKSFADNVAMFKQFFDTNGWDVSHYGDASQVPNTYFYAYKDKNEAGVTIAQSADNKVTVTITYVAR